MKKNDPIIFCGYTTSAETVISELREQNIDNEIIILSKQNVPKIEGTQHYSFDYSLRNNLKRKEVNIKNCSICVVFSEFHGNEDPKTVDIRTFLTIYNIKQENKKVRVIAEIIDDENSGIIANLECDDIIHKENVDGNLIMNCIIHPNLSPIFYDLLTIKGKVLKEISLSDMGFNISEKIIYKDIKMYGLENDITFLGFLAPDNQVQLMPKNEEVVSPDYRLIYIQ